MAARQRLVRLPRRERRRACAAALRGTSVSRTASDSSHASGTTKKTSRKPVSGASSAIAAAGAHRRSGPPPRAALLRADPGVERWAILSRFSSQNFGSAVNAWFWISGIGRQLAHQRRDRRRAFVVTP